MILLALSLTSPALAEKKPKGDASIKEQLRFGVKMAERGLWREALFRFERAQEIDPQNSEVLNNMAVAHEALGLFDEALALYRQALEIDPENRTLRRNYARFVEFYQAYRPTPPEGSKAEGENGAGEGSEQPPTLPDSGENEEGGEG